MMIQSIQKQKQTNSTKGAGVTQPLSQSVKQIQSQINELQKQVARIHKYGKRGTEFYSVIDGATL